MSSLNVAFVTSDKSELPTHVGDVARLLFKFNNDRLHWATAVATRGAHEHHSLGKYKFLPVLSCAPLTAYSSPYGNFSFPSGKRSTSRLHSLPIDFPQQRYTTYFQPPFTIKCRVKRERERTKKNKNRSEFARKSKRNAILPNL